MSVVHKIMKKFYWYLRSWPIERQNRFYDIVLGYIPIWILKLIPCSYSAYLKCYKPRKGDVILDCGAHHGNCAVLFSRLVGKKGRVFALEPFKDSMGILNNRIKHLGRDNITTMNKGIWSHSGKIYLEITSSSFMCKTISVDEYANVKNKEDFIEIDCITIDDLTSQLNLEQIHMVKMDIEGAEIEALTGAKNTALNFSPHFAIASYHIRDNEQTCHRVEEFLNNYGYKSNTFFPQHLTTCGEKLENAH